MFPVEERIPAIRAALARNRDVVLTAPPGSGKTTCVPPALLDEPWLAGRKIVMLEPRRLAARNCAAYIARKRGEELGGTVGYQVRLERKVSAVTRLEIITEGLLAQRILADPELADTGLVIFDEFHERALPCDLAFALALDVRRALRPDMRLLVMSATLDADSIAAHLGDADIVRAEGRMYPVRTQYLGDVSMSAAIAKAKAETDGNILCFLPGEGEIRRVAAAVPGALPLYGALPKDEQDRVFRNDGVRKVILSTSIAETSVTVPDVTAVIDSGQMRIARFSPASGMTGLVTLPVTQDRAEQRRGRAGRVRAGVCYRLWTESDDASHPARMMPEILDADLAGLVLSSASWGALRREDLPWMTPPPASAWERAVTLLRALGALDETGRLTEKGGRMARLPMHPRLANMLLGGGDPLWAAIIEEGAKSRETDIRYVTRTSRVEQLAKRFQALCSKREAPANASRPSPGASLALAYPDRIAKSRGNGTFRMVGGRGAFLPEDDPLAHEPYVVACSLDDRVGDARLFLGCPISEGEILDLFGDQIVEEPFCEWDRANERVKCVLRRRLGAMTFGERPVTGSADPDTAERITAALVDGIRQKGVENMPCWTKEALQLKARVAFAARHCGWQAVDDARLLAALPGYVGGMTKWRDLERLNLIAVFDGILAEGGHDRRELDRLAPSRMEVPSGSHMTISYEGEEPTVSVRLQECFGLMDTPRLANGKVAVVMTLLSPAHRPIQVTKDLAGFWRGAYQLVRKDMRGRYPKHYWPEDPLTAVATRRTTVRRS